jgi:hypothetical protein
MAKKQSRFSKRGTNVKPTAAQQQTPPPDPSHPGQLLPPVLPGGPYYRQKGANG